MDSLKYRRITRLAFFPVAAGTLLAMSGLYGTDSLGWPLVWLYWVVLLSLGVWFGMGIRQQLISALPRRTPWAVHWLAVSLTLTVPMTGLVALAQTAIGFPVSPEMLANFAFKVFVVVLGVTGTRLLAIGTLPVSDREVMTELAPTGAITEDITGTVPPRFARRLPPKLRGATIWALSAEDHYVRVYTSKGDDLVLIRLTDAIDEMAGVEGLRTHRSWWVAQSGIDTAQRRTQGSVIVLKNGVKAPVARSRIPAIQAQGWFETHKRV
ncbi:LytTR family transcriptional regulator [Eilatimonas milleporae]|uniref:LytTR family transcriptional regulator n=2 Tax=Eilatimonas milleporae TaxID=911205 RepID=A0A3M0C533_9PROT|nr:LytTR family transcriptional regulator [Eilatimonas milleporae]